MAKTTTVTLLLFAFFGAWAQATNQKGFVLKGHIDGVENGTKVYLHDIDAQRKIDSTTTSNGDFVLKGRVEKPTACWVECRDQYATLMVENVAMTFTSPLSNMMLYAKAQGGREQQLQSQLAALRFPYEKIYFTAYDSLTKKLFSDKAHEKRLIKQLYDYQDSALLVYIDFGKQHPNSYLGIDVIYRNRQKIARADVERLYAQLSDQLKASTKGEALRTFLYGNLAKKGENFIDFEAATTEGSVFKLSSLKGRYILLSFWSATCVPCRRENKNISKDFDNLKDKLAFVSFSLDKNRNAWVNASRDDNILWANVSDLKGDASQIKALYDVQGIPTSFLISPDGKILEKYTGLADDFLSQLLKKVNGENVR